MSDMGGKARAKPVEKSVETLEELAKKHAKPECLGHPKCITQQVRRRGWVTRHASYCPLG